MRGPKGGLHGIYVAIGRSTVLYGIIRTFQDYLPSASLVQLLRKQ